MTLSPICKAVFTASLLLLTGACATTSQNNGDANDPWEGMNRATYGFNKAIDKAIYRPITGAYLAVVPEIPRKGVSNAMRNLRDPWVFVNDILQFKFKRAGETLGRFIVNSTIGVGGLFKVSEKMGIPYHSEDLGQTLAVWGVGDGPYFMIPFVGPSNGRDTVGFVTYFFADPTYFAIKETDVKGLNLIRTGIDALDARADAHQTLENLYNDPEGYELMRSAYRQSRNYKIHDGNPPQEDSDIFDDLEDEDESKE